LFLNPNVNVLKLGSVHKEGGGGIMVHCDLKVASSSEKIDEKFSNYFLKTKANNKGFKELKRTCKGQQKSIGELEFIKSKPKALRHFKVDPVFL